jgi:hypothetical protein
MCNHYPVHDETMGAHLLKLETRKLCKTSVTFMTIHVPFLANSMKEKYIFNG